MSQIKVSEAIVCTMAVPSNRLFVHSCHIGDPEEGGVLSLDGADLEIVSVEMIGDLAWVTTVPISDRYTSALTDEGYIQPKFV